MQEESTFHQIGTDAEVLEGLKNKDPVSVFFQLSKKIDEVLRVQKETKDIANETRDALFNPETGLHGRVKSIEEWKKELLSKIDEKIVHCKESCHIENGNIRLTTVEKSLEQIKKFQWLIGSALVTAGIGLLIKTVFPSAAQAMGLF